MDDHEIVRKGIRSLLEAEPDLEVVREAGSAGEALRRVGFDSPDIVVLDVRLPDGSGVEACRDIRSASPDVKGVTVKNYVSNLLTKLGMSRRSEAAAYAARATAPKPDTDREDWGVGRGAAI